jgi:carboxypeptidase Taq
MTWAEDLTTLKNRARDIQDLYNTSAVLAWDQETLMPPKAGPARGRMFGLITRLAHERISDQKITSLLASVESSGKLKVGSDDAAFVRLLRRLHEQAVRVPSELVAEIAEHDSGTQLAWAQARPANDFASVEPLLAKSLELRKRVSEYFPEHAHPLDTHIDNADEGMNVALLRTLFSQLRDQLVPLVQAVTAKPVPDESFLQQRFPKAKQLAFSHKVLARLGYDFEAGRLDESAHPFSITLGAGDKRITTRVRPDESDVLYSLMSTIHEFGHSTYEQNIKPEYDGTPLFSGASSGVHESQSRLWENIVGRSRGFWTYWFPRLQRTFGKALKDVDLETFLRAINRVETSLIRTEADELTYNLHIIIRFDLECELMEGKLAVKDLPEAWGARYQSDLGRRAPDNRDGVMQDVHWYGGGWGIFQSYTLGNILSAQFYAAALKQQPELSDQLAAAKTAGLHRWLKKNIYQHGAKFTPAELVQRVTGSPMSIDPYIAYLREKYTALYGL